MKDSLQELENVLLDQIEKLNDDSINTEKEDVRNMIERSAAISKLTSNYLSIQNHKLSIVKTMKDIDPMFKAAQYLRLESKKQ